MSQRAIIAGCGYVGEALARLLQSHGWQVTGLVHSPESAARLTASGLPAIACDITEATSLGNVAPGAVVIHCASSSGGGAEAYGKIYLQAAHNLLDALRPSAFLFTSSTSVYAQTGGEWVTEDSPAEPTRDTGQILRATEELVLSRGGLVARLAGIYGPGRWALLRKFLEGSAVIEEGGTRWINHIHRDDAATAIYTMLNIASRPGICNVADSTSLSQREAYETLAAHYGRSLPPEGPAGARKRGNSSKRVSNEKLRSLGWAPRYPSIREAIASGDFDI